MRWETRRRPSNSRLLIAEIDQLPQPASCEAGHMNEEQPFQLPGIDVIAGAAGVPRLVGPPRALAAGVDTGTVVLVEGISDKFALEAVAQRLVRNLATEVVSIVL